MLFVVSSFYGYGTYFQIFWCFLYRFRYVPQHLQISTNKILWQTGFPMCSPCWLCLTVLLVVVTSVCFSGSSQFSIDSAVCSYKHILFFQQETCMTDRFFFLAFIAWLSVLLFPIYQIPHNFKKKTCVFVLISLFWWKDM